MSRDGLRIIGGRWRSRRLEAPPGRAVTRPLPDRIRQSLFDYLGQDCGGARIADCCAGSGAFGFEAASRGAAAVHLIERDPTALAILAANHRALGAPAEIRIEAGDAVNVLLHLEDLDCVFCDPPFPCFRDDPAFIAALLELGGAALRGGGLLLIRGERGVDLPSLPSGLSEIDRRSYGRSWVAVLER